MRDIILYEILIPSLHILYKIDYKNILYGVSERNICARLAHHIENKMRKYDRERETTLFRGYYADVEYDKLGDGSVKQYGFLHDRPKRMISDLLIQSRGEPRNLLAVEMKRKKNYDKRGDDRKRLMAMVSESHEGSDLYCVYDTLVGTFIIFSKDGVKIEVYESVKGIGARTAVIELAYDVGRGLIMEYA